MAKLSPKQIYALAREAGLEKLDALYATAIALAESGGQTDVVNDNPSTGDLSYGLWQINMLGKMGPERRQALGISSNEALKDPHVNARAMALISNKGKNFNPWTTYGSRAYQEHLQTVLMIPTTDWQETLKGIPGAIGRIGTGVAGAGAEAIVGPILAGGRRIVVEGVFVTLGLVLVGMGAWQAVGPTVKGAARTGAQIAGAAATKGAA